MLTFCTFALAKQKFNYLKFVYNGKQRDFETGVHRNGVGGLFIFYYVCRVCIIKYYHAMRYESLSPLLRLMTYLYVGYYIVSHIIKLLEC